MTELDDQQLEEIETSLTRGKSLVDEAEQLRQAGFLAGTRRDWQGGIEAYEQSRGKYQQAVTDLQRVSALIGTSDFRALVLAHDEAKALLAQAQNTLDELQAQQPWQSYKQHQITAREFLDQARAYLQNGDIALARSHAIQARDQDPVLQEDADRLTRDADALEGEAPNVVRWIVLAVIAAVVIGVAIFFGPGVWAWFSEFFFPASAVVQQIFGSGTTFI
ncbi:hypothetical protein HC928_16380 [bacterium]|nr:hypothetical protein [bacterium]